MCAGVRLPNSPAPEVVGGYLIEKALEFPDVGVGLSPAKSLDLLTETLEGDEDLPQVPWSAGDSFRRAEDRGSDFLEPAVRNPARSL